MNNDQNQKKYRDKYAERMAQEFIGAMEAGTAPWQKPWKAGEASFPFNAITGRPYTGFNVMALLKRGFSDPRWITKNQAVKAGHRIRRSEFKNGVNIRFWITEEYVSKKDDDGNVIKDANGDAVREKIELKWPKQKFYNLYNVSQLEQEFDPYEPGEIDAFAITDRVSRILSVVESDIFHDQRDRAFYRQSTDSIHMPNRELFSDEMGYFGTLFHEIAHSTGSPKRLARDMSGGFGSATYACEELVAEAASTLFCCEFGLPHDPSQHQAYVKSWIRKLNDDPTFIIKAFKEAQKALDYILDLEEAALGVDGNDVEGVKL